MLLAFTNVLCGECNRVASLWGATSAGAAGGIAFSHVANTALGAGGAIPDSGI